MPNSRCVVCGGFVLVGEICRGCEEKTLKEAKSKARILSTVTMTFFLIVLLRVWQLYGQDIMDMDTAPIRNYPFAFEISFEILKSPKLFPLAIVGLVLIVLAFLYEMFFKKIFLGGFKNYLT